MCAARGGQALERGPAPSCPLLPYLPPLLGGSIAAFLANATRGRVVAAPADPRLLSAARVAYGAIFSDILSSGGGGAAGRPRYNTHWAWADTDVLFGNLAAFLEPVARWDADVITFGKAFEREVYLAGGFTVLRNSAAVRWAFLDLMDPECFARSFQEVDGPCAYPDERHFSQVSEPPPPRGGRGRGMA